MYNNTHKDKCISVEAKINEGIKLSLKYTKPETALNAYIKYIGEMMQADRLYIYEKDEFAQDVNSYEWTSENLTSDKRVCYELSSELCDEFYKKFENDEYIIIYDINEIKDVYPELYDIFNKNGITSYVAGPIMGEDCVVGFYGIDNFRMDSSECTTEVAKSIAYFMETSIRRRNLYNELMDAGAQDHLTRLGNRYSFVRQIERWKNSDNVVCVVFDVNNLKLCNDRYGHTEGDRLILDAAQCINNSFGKIGKCFRVGGDEFYALIKNCDMNAINQAEEEFRLLLEKININRTPPLFVAYGYRAREAGETLDHLVIRSDEAMYEMKYRMKQQFPVYCEERLKNYRKVLEILSKSTDDYLYMFEVAKGESHFFGDVNKQFPICEDRGTPISLEELFSIVHPDDVLELQTDFMKLGTGESMIHNMNYRWINRDGEPIWINCRGKVINDDKGKPFVMIGRVSDTALKYMVNLLTGLFNESKYFKDMNGLVASGNTGYLLFIRINDLNNINIEHGREYGDKIIKNLALVLEIVAKDYKIYHMESVYFCVCVNDGDEQTVQELYDRINEKKYNVYTTVACAVKYGPDSDETKLFAKGKQTMLYAQINNDSYEKVLFTEKEQ